MKNVHKQSLVIVGLLVVLVGSLGYLYASEDESGNRQVVSRGNDIKKYIANKVQVSDDINKLVDDLSMLIPCNEDGEMQVYIGEETRAYADELARDFRIEISEKTLYNKSYNEIKDFLDNDFFIVLEEYIGEGFRDDLLEMATGDIQEEYLDYVRKIYTEANVIVQVNFYYDKDVNSEDTKQYSGGICIKLSDYKVEPSQHKEIDKMIRGDGYRLAGIYNRAIGSRMSYIDQSENITWDGKCIVGEEEVRTSMDADIFVGEDGTTGATLFVKALIGEDKEVQIAKHQQELVSRIVGLLKIEGAETKIKEVLLAQRKDQIRPVTIKCDGYELKVGHFKESGYSNGREEYYYRIDIIKDK